MVGLAAEVRFGEAEAPDQFPARHLWKPPILLLVGSERPDREHAERPLHTDEGAEPRVACLQLQADQTVRHGVRPEATVSLEVHPEQTQRTQLQSNLFGELPPFEPLLDAGQDIVVHPCANEASDLAFFVREQVVDVDEVERFDVGHAPG